jgi:hypothetical protein
MRTALACFAALMLSSSLAAQPRPPRSTPPSKGAGPYKTTLSVAAMTGKQAVIETSQGTIVIEFLPQAAPNHVGHFIEQARQGAYDKTTFHRAVKMGIIQGGDPLSKDPCMAPADSVS